MSNLNTVSNVTTGKPKVGGAIFRAPLGTTLPTTADAALDAAFKCLGYCSDAGVVNSTNIETQKIKAWGGDVVLVAQNGKEDSFKFVLIETKNVEAAKAVYGDENVSGDLSTGITITANSKEQADCCFVVDMELRNHTKKRVVIPCGRVTAVDDITYNDTAAVGYGTTISAQPDSNENTHYEYIKATGATGATA